MSVVYWIRRSCHTMIGVEGYIGVSSRPERRFTEWAKRHRHDGVTSAAIEEGLASRSISVRKMTQFAKNSRMWNH